MCKFSQEDLRRFNERLMNALQNDECRKYFTEFINKQLLKYRRAFKIWTIVYDSKSEEPHINVLENMELKELMDACSYLDGNECVEEIETKSVEYLNKLHRKFMKFIKTKNNTLQSNCSTSSQ
ncbi:PREDICTED: uncharacterized protein LOC108567017 [Nicrophorus vespilloides]|uniref:Uncharacterized protein LOC108567017 n=1 Tax=Nicrophorus vespilloides TaxID=110193 RepID=A0ABM1N788_NICVS|nr:PREDICTED: uncharacterized protein LOC108567017 [Nicrophorus vespilloides]